MVRRVFCFLCGFCHVLTLYAGMAGQQSWPPVSYPDNDYFLPSRQNMQINDKKFDEQKAVWPEVVDQFDDNDWVSNSNNVIANSKQVSPFNPYVHKEIEQKKTGLKKDDCNNQLGVEQKVVRKIFRTASREVPLSPKTSRNIDFVELSLHAEHIASHLPASQDLNQEGQTRPKAASYPGNSPKSKGVCRSPESRKRTSPNPWNNVSPEKRDNIARAIFGLHQVIRSKIKERFGSDSALK
jgi:hypothetical protein